MIRGLPPWRDGLPPWYHLWHSWSDWGGLGVKDMRTKVWSINAQVRYCVDCGRLQFRREL